MTKEQIDDAWEKFKQGIGLKEIAADYGTTGNTLSVWLRKYGYEPKGYMDARRDERNGKIMAEWLNGMTSRQIADKYHMTIHETCRILRREKGRRGIETENNEVLTFAEHRKPRVYPVKIHGKWYLDVSESWGM